MDWGGDKTRGVGGRRGRESYWEWGEGGLMGVAVAVFVYLLGGCIGYMGVSSCSGPEILG